MWFFLIWNKIAYFTFGLLRVLFKKLSPFGDFLLLLPQKTDSKSLRSERWQNEAWWFLEIFCRKIKDLTISVSFDRRSRPYCENKCVLFSNNPPTPFQCIIYNVRIIELRKGAEASVWAGSRSISCLQDSISLLKDTAGMGATTVVSCVTTRLGILQPLALVKRDITYKEHMLIKLSKVIQKNVNIHRLEEFRCTIWEYSHSWTSENEKKKKSQEASVW